MNGDANARPSSDPNSMQEQVRGDTPAPFITPHPDFATYGDSRLKLAEGLINEEIEAERCSGNRLQTAHMENRMRALQAEKRRRNGFSANAALNTQPTLDDEAFHGLAGDVVKAIAPYTEAADVALLVNTLAAFGNIIGSSAHARVVTDQHPGRLFVAQVGDTSKGRKNSGWSPIKYLFSLVDADWAKQRVKSGLSTGEGLIYNVRDPQEEEQPVKENGRVVDYQTVQTDAGETDKRLMIVEPEFAATLAVMARDGNTLSPVLRQAWDEGDLAPLTKNNRMTATGAHITLITFITSQELALRLDDTSKANGFANRFLWATVTRSKELPEGAEIPEGLLQNLAVRLNLAMDFASKVGVVSRDEAAKALWAQVYGPLSAGKLGLLGAVLSRAEAQVLRLSVIYALLDSSPTVSVEHLKAALAVWDYCEQSAATIFGNKIGDRVADRILEALHGVGDKGLTDNDIYNLFGGNKSAKDRGRALSLLTSRGLVRTEIVKTSGRPKTTWWAT